MRLGASRRLAPCASWPDLKKGKKFVREHTRDLSQFAVFARNCNFQTFPAFLSPCRERHDITRRNLLQVAQRDTTFLACKSGRESTSCKLRKLEWPCACAAAHSPQIPVSSAQVSRAMHFAHRERERSSISTRNSRVVRDNPICKIWRLFPEATQQLCHSQEIIVKMVQ